MREENYPEQLYIHPLTTDENLLKSYHRENNHIQFFVRRHPSDLTLIDVFYTTHDQIIKMTLGYIKETPITQIVINALRQHGVFSEKITDAQILLDHQAIIDSSDSFESKRCQSVNRAALFHSETEGMGERQNAFSPTTFQP